MNGEVAGQAAKREVDMPKLEEVSTLSVKSLKEVIEACGESATGITDKSELQSKVCARKGRSVTFELLHARQ